MRLPMSNIAAITITIIAQTGSIVEWLLLIYVSNNIIYIDSSKFRCKFGPYLIASIKKHIETLRFMIFTLLKA